MFEIIGWPTYPDPTYPATCVHSARALTEHDLSHPQG